jgi:hypothetical protein
MPGRFSIHFFMNFSVKLFMKFMPRCRRETLPLVHRAGASPVPGDDIASLPLCLSASLPPVSPVWPGAGGGMMSPSSVDSECNASRFDEVVRLGVHIDRVWRCQMMDI